MSCTNFKAPLIQRMYSLVISWQYISKEGKTKILQTLDVIYQEQHFHGKFRVIPMDSFTQRFHVSTSNRSHFYARPVLYIQNTFFFQWPNCIFTGHWKCSQVRSVQKRLSATYRRKKGKSYHEYSQESKPEWMHINYQRSFWSLLCRYTGLITIEFWLLEHKRVINSTITIIY